MSILKVDPYGQRKHQRVSVGDTSEKLRFPRMISLVRGLRRLSAVSSTLYQMILARGPISVADYMRLALTNASTGYYMNRDVFGAKGDFITSPEISQLFGEMLGIWCVHLWRENGEPSSFRLVELGPGRGTLASDVVRLSRQFSGFDEALKVDMVEISPKMQELQRKALENFDKDTSSFRWFDSIQALPVESSSFTVFLAHEFFDALPVYQFVLTRRGWREILVDVVSNEAGGFRFVKAPGPTPALGFMENRVLPADLEALEVCPSAGLVTLEICRHLSCAKGAALVIDYGRDGPGGLTLRGFRKHSLHDVLLEPGSVDLTADVDFSYIKEFVGSSAKCLGPMTQREFLKKMGIDVRLRALEANASEDVAKDLHSGYNMLVGSTAMGSRFKVMTIISNGMVYPYPFLN